jgi:hypothetical protein
MIKKAIFLLLIASLLARGCGDIDVKTFEVCNFGMKFPCGRYQANTSNPDYFIKLELINKLADSTSSVRDIYVYFESLDLRTASGKSLPDYSICFNDIHDQHCRSPGEGGPDVGNGEIDLRVATRDSAILHREDEARILMISIDNPEEFKGERLTGEIRLGYYQSSPAFPKSLKGDVRFNVK